ncbi:hypothetical protein [Klenkia sp. PcliD-1-E]|uniref:hypothetical protein n=1 Tax=Klenkia sp. PcliD-1-E TaxID=2954492 RepID=UPI002097B2AC|nr:hypothetical protein [Klenkia sp. PcliD-1-E]MCO7218934.1 hypothetical protein [Klenkia sp. PcliD-1-E]
MIAPPERGMRHLHGHPARTAGPPEAARAFGRVAADLRSSGREPAARVDDALIAASAIAEGVPLYTYNPADFAGISGLDLRKVPHPDATGDTSGT